MLCGVCCECVDVTCVLCMWCVCAVWYVLLVWRECVICGGLCVLCAMCMCVVSVVCGTSVVCDAWCVVLGARLVWVCRACVGHVWCVCCECGVW